MLKILHLQVVLYFASLIDIFQATNIGTRLFLSILLVFSVAFVVLLTSKYKLHPFMALLGASFIFGIGAGMPLTDITSAINSGFGDTIGYIGIVIICGSIIGTILQKSGGAYRIAQSILAISGKTNVTPTMGIVGYIVSLPVFCDSGYVLLSPVNKALAKKAGSSLTAGAVALSLGLFASHTMVPPTPGPVAAAGILNADLGLVILLGLGISFTSLLAGITFAHFYASKHQLEDSLSDIEPNELYGIQTDSQPSLLQSCGPIAFPIILIVMGAIAKLPSSPFGDNRFAELMVFIGQPSVALLLGVLIAFTIPKKLDRTVVSDKGLIGEAILAAAVIIILTGAGGAFGRVLQSSEIATVLGDILRNAPLGILMPFILAAAIKTAQGSSTVAIITTSSIMAPLLSELTLDGEMQKALVVVAIGAGSMVVSHVNDSYFWVVTQFSGMSVKQGYKLHTLGSLLQGVVAAVAVTAVSAVL